MSIEYKLGKTNSGKYQQLGCDEDSGAIVRALSMLNFGDSIYFRKQKENGLIFGSYWGLGDIGCFKELSSYTRLMNIPEHNINKLAIRMYELLFMRIKNDERYNIEPKIDKTKQEYQQILEELTILQKTQKRLVDLSEIVF